MRLIDADELDRIMYHKAFEVDDGRNVWNSGLWIRYKIYEEASEEAKTFDAVPVIRCKDCKYWHCDDVDTYCYKLSIFDTDMNSYCSYAERKEEYEDEKEMEKL